MDNECKDHWELTRMLERRMVAVDLRLDELSGMRGGVAALERDTAILPRIAADLGAIENRLRGVEMGLARISARATIALSLLIPIAIAASIAALRIS